VQADGVMSKLHWEEIKFEDFEKETYLTEYDRLISWSDPRLIVFEREGSKIVLRAYSNEELSKWSHMFKEYI